MRANSAYAGKSAMAFGRRRGRRDMSPDHAKNQTHHQQNPNAFVQFGGLMIPTVIIA
ncbi:Uncharacterised protein [Enterobacter cloacae]|nr:Uncharacterised protein [Enterobacter cloacae]